MQLLTLVGMLITIASVVFAMANTTEVTVTLMNGSFTGPLGVVLLMALAVGGLIVALVSTPGTLRRQWRIKHLDKRVAELEKTCAAQKDRIERLERGESIPELTPTPAFDVNASRLMF